MKNSGLYQLFMEELFDIYDAEKQLIETLPDLAKHASIPDLKEAISHHLKETKQQKVRIEKICSILNVEVEESTCEAMEGLLAEGKDLIKNKAKSSALDAAIICAAQKVEHYEIATYGSLRSFAKQLDFPSEVVDLLQDTLDEEGAADRKLTKIAEGSFFSSGVNKEAAEPFSGTKYR